MATGKRNYFRHSFSAHRDDKIMEAVDKYGKQAYFHYFVLLELCGEIAEHGEQTEFVFHPRILCNNLLVKKNKLRMHLEYLHNILLIFLEYSDDKVKITVPNLPKYLGSYKKEGRNKEINKINKEQKNVESTERAGKPVDSPREISDILKEYSR